jgi:predicted  nucleic acid-binding Zn-ribbon protein
MAKSVLEDEIIELYEKIDLMSQQVPEMTQGLETAEQELEQFVTRFEMRTQELTGQIEQLEKDLHLAEKILPQEPAEKYRRLVKSRGSRALALVANNSCSSCFVQMTPQQKILIKSNTFVFCSNCGALLYLEE